jgi:hypothetical protein
VPRPAGDKQSDRNGERERERKRKREKEAIQKLLRDG